MKKIVSLIYAYLALFELKNSFTLLRTWERGEKGNIEKKITKYVYYNFMLRFALIIRSFVVQFKVAMNIISSSPSRVSSSAPAV